jgi:hypothetical protein
VPAPHADVTPPSRWWDLPLRVSVPWTSAAAGALPSQVSVPVGPVQTAARTAARTIPWVLVVLGATVSLVAAFVIERDLGDAVGGLGVELGAALWFAGALTLGARQGATVRRAVALLALALAGVVLVVLAFVLDLSGAALDLALEYGVGAVAVAVIDVVLLGTLHARLERLGDAPEQVVTLSVGGPAPWVAVRSSDRPPA